MLKRLFKKGIVLAVVTWFIFCAAVYFMPQIFFYNPSGKKASLNNAQANGFNAEEVTYEAEDGTELYGWYVEPKNQQKVIVYFHGNSYNIEKFYHKLIPLAEAGYGVFIGEYRGFGGIRGQVNQQNFEKDALAAVNYVHARGWKNNDIILYGMSLGSYTALYTAYHEGGDTPFAAVILEVPFDSLYKTVKQRIWPLFPFKLLVKDTYDNIPLVQNIKSPLLIMAGTEDKTVPVERARALFAAAPDPKQLIVYKGAEHPSLYNHRNWRDILNWLKQNEKTK